MDLREFVIEAMTLSRTATLAALDGLTDAEYRWQPDAQANPICFLLLHLARTEDRYFHRWVAPAPQVWQRDGWEARTGLSCSESPREVGNGWTVEDVRAFPYPSLEGVLDYLSEVRKDSLAAVRGLDLSRLSIAPRPSTPENTIANYLQRTITHESEHRGAIEYVRGLRRASQAGSRD